MLPRKGFLFVVAVALFAALLIFALPITAQEGTATSDMPTVCDSTTILLLLLARRDYGFQSETIDLTSFEFGQFQSEFDAVQMNEAMATEEAPATEEAEMTATEEVVEPEHLVTLLSAIVSGEDPRCVELRTEVEEYLWDQIQAGNPGGGVGFDRGLIQ
jgi:hypothetical protein